MPRSKRPLWAMWVSRNLSTSGSLMTKSTNGTGYCNPPTKTRFQPGMSGNPKGRPKGSRSFRTEILEELAELIPAADAGAPAITKLRAIVRRLVSSAIEGEPRAIGIVIACCSKLFADIDENSELSADDQEIMRSFAKRRQVAPVKPALLQQSNKN